MTKTALAGASSLRWQNFLRQQTRWNGGKVRVTVNQRRVLPQSRGGNQNIHRGYVSGCAGAQTNRLSPHGFVHVPSGARHTVANVGSDIVRFVSVFALDPPGVGLLDPLPEFE